MLNIEWSTVSIGNILTIVMIIFVAGGFYYITKTDVSALKDNVYEIKESLKVLSKILTELAVQDKRLENQTEQVNQLRGELIEMRYGRGFVK
jgi:F0F1-type ATP synthase epsilon subunit